jgi:hypothetical protein
MWQLVIRDGGTPHSRTQFPIFDHDADFARETKISRQKNGRGRIGSLVGLDTDSLALLESIQPYQLIEEWGGPFWVLREFSNFDKHRDLHLTGAIQHAATWDIEAVQVGNSEPELIQRHTGPIEDTTLTHHFRLVDGILSDKVKVEKEATFIVVFGNGSPVPGLAVIKGLDDIRKRVIWLVREVEIKRFHTTPSFPAQV